MALTWLHVSDFHLDPSTNWDVDHVLKELVESVEWYRNNGWKPDLIFATGDIAGKGKVAVFKGEANARATIFFDKLLDAAKLQRESLFIVPGNHDVVRVKGLCPIPTTESEINRYFNSKLVHLKKLKSFSAWYNEYFKDVNPKRVFPEQSTCELIPYKVNKDGAEVSLKMLLLNSTLFCENAKDDVGKLCIGRSCIVPLIEQLKTERVSGDASLVIAMMHHPFFVLHASESYSLKNALTSEVDIILQGHMHQPHANFGELVELGSGAAYYSIDSSKDAMYCRFDGKKIEVYPICYYKNSSQWMDNHDVFYKTRKSTKSYEIPRLRNSAIPSPVVTTGTNGKQVKTYGKSYQEFLIAALDHVLPTAVQGFSPKVSNIFVSLSLSDRWQSEENYSSEEQNYDSLQNEDGFSAEEVMRVAYKKNRLLLVIGDPGQGKTTLLQHYALSCIDKDRCKAFGFDEPVMVFYLQLRELKKGESGYVALPVNILAWAQTVPLSEKERPENLETLIFESLSQQKSLVLLDGLDEISELEERKKVCEWITNTITDFPKSCFVVTSRPTGYRPVDDIEIQAALKRADILDFKPWQQKKFLQNWFAEMFLSELHPSGVTKENEWEKNQKEKADKKAEDVIEFLNKDGNKSLLKLAGIPLMLQIMAMLWYRNNNLPESRSALYEQVLNYLLGYQYKRRKKTPKLGKEDAIRVLAPVSLWMQEELRQDEAGQAAMKEKIEVELNNIPSVQERPKATAFIDDLINQAGLLVSYGKMDYAFRHKSFREYLVSVQLMKNPVSDLSVQKLIKHFSEPFWEEPIRFFFGQIDAELFNTFMHTFFDSVSEDVIQQKQGLLQTIIEETPKEKRKIDALCNKLLDSEIDTGRMWVILVCLNAIGNHEALPVLKKFRARQLAQGFSINREIISRTENVIIAFGGKALQGDNHLSFRNPSEHNSEYILIPGGRYIYSETGKEEPVTDLYVAKYPVTNKLYRSFIAALGNVPELKEKLNEIAKKENWLAGFEKYHEGTGDLATLFRSEYDEKRKFDGEDQPVVGVTWYAARAYCLWLSLLENKDEKINSYRLPTEIEWEWAAGGRQGTIGKKVRQYPWADEKGKPTSKLLNYDNNVGATTPVGSYPDGATPEGLYDMAGNVWEWSDSWYDEKTRSYRVLRGGSWYDYAEICRSAYRDSNDPVGRTDVVGFRPVFVP